MILVGVDEVGRGPLAGPVAVCVAVFSGKNLHKIFPEARDSKKMSLREREKVFKQVKEVGRKDIIRYIVRYESSKVIDKKGLTWAINSCIEKSFKKLALDPKNTKVLLDGGLKAPKIFTNQKTIIKGDQKEKIISIASIVAKVSRDSLMEKFSKKFPQYGFEVHKGYGTAKHRSAIKKHGLSSIHRKTFTTRL